MKKTLVLKLKNGEELISDVDLDPQIKIIDTTGNETVAKNVVLLQDPMKIYPIMDLNTTTGTGVILGKWCLVSEQRAVLLQKSEILTSFKPNQDIQNYYLEMLEEVLLNNITELSEEEQQEVMDLRLLNSVDDKNPH